MENFIPHKQGQKYDSDEDRKEGFRISQLRYSAKPWYCEICSKTMRLGNKTKHLRSKKHMDNLCLDDTESN